MDLSVPLETYLKNCRRLKKLRKEETKLRKENKVLLSTFPWIGNVEGLILKQQAKLAPPKEQIQKSGDLV
jgi:hypothetical protein